MALVRGRPCGWRRLNSASGDSGWGNPESNPIPRRNGRKEKKVEKAEEAQIGRLRPVPTRGVPDGAPINSRRRRDKPVAKDR